MDERWQVQGITCPNGFCGAGIVSFDSVFVTVWPRIEVDVDLQDGHVSAFAQVDRLEDRLEVEVRYHCEQCGATARLVSRANQFEEYVDGERLVRRLRVKGPEEAAC